MVTLRSLVAIVLSALCFAVLLETDLSAQSRRSRQAVTLDEGGDTETPAPLPVSNLKARQAVRSYHKLASTTWTSPNVLQSLSELAGFDHPAVVDCLLDVLSNGRIYQRPTARRVLSSLSSPASLERIATEGLAHDDAAVRENVLLALADGRPSGFDWVAAATKALEDKSPPVRAAAVRAVGLGRSRPAMGALLELADDPSQRVRIAVPKALVRLAGQRALPVLRALSKDSQWRVRVGVVSALVDLKSERAVVELIAMLGQEQGRVREDILTALKTLTGKSHGVNMDAWERFLERAPVDFLSQENVEKQEQERLRTTVARYYGLATLSRRFLFITDLSTSMSHVDPGRYGNSPPAADAPRSSRLSLTQQELAKLLDGLADDVLFNLATFSDITRLWHDDMKPATRRNKTAALREVEEYGVIGGTNIFSSLQVAFDLAEAQLDAPRQDQAAPDTVFLLTDGEPSVGRLTDIGLLLEYVAERNRVLGLRFQCIALTRDTRARDFLARLAKHTGGGYVCPLD
ncbi:MAG: hypothetical protein ACI9EF_001150 [Pseudohongiellaceae bacterium]|jgi:hypothetical protein